jgi:predicted alpha/beta superfamily hydrolase
MLRAKSQPGGLALFYDIDTVILRIYNRNQNRGGCIVIIQKMICIPELSGDLLRKVYIYTPESYETNERKYPVLYMFDGHNVFYDKDATFGKSWGMTEYLSKSKKELMVVAVAANPEGNCRLEEYSPVDFLLSPLEKIVGRGEAYMHWMVNTLKPYIDSNYPTLSDREHTAICGSSMGGLMSAYAVSAYNYVFSKAACLSPSFWVNPREIKSLLEHNDMISDTRIYMDYGSEELCNHQENTTILNETLALLQHKGASASLRIVPGGTHCEASWEKQIPVFMDYLGL